MIKYQLWRCFVLALHHLRCSIWIHSLLRHCSEWDSFTLNCLWRLLLNVDFGKMGPISYALELIKNSPNLSKLEISVRSTSNNPEAILKYPDTPSCLKQPLDYLEYVAVNDFLLSADIVLNGQPSTLNCLWHLYLGVDFGKMGPISYALQLIKSSPNLSKLDIRVHATSYNAEAILKYLDTPSCLERTLNKLEHVSIRGFRSSKAELLFVKLLLSRTPSLLKMRIDQFSDIDIGIALELMRFPRASPRAELLYSRYKG